VCSLYRTYVSVDFIGCVITVAICVYVYICVHLYIHVCFMYLYICTYTPKYFVKKRRLTIAFNDLCQRVRASSQWRWWLQMYIIFTYASYTHTRTHTHTHTRARARARTTHARTHTHYFYSNFQRCCKRIGRSLFVSSNLLWLDLWLFKIHAFVCEPLFGNRVEVNVHFYSFLRKIVRASFTRGSKIVVQL